MKQNSKWHQVGLSFFNYYNDARSNKYWVTECSFVLAYIPGVAWSITSTVIYCVTDQGIKKYYVWCNVLTRTTVTLFYYVNTIPSTVRSMTPEIEVFNAYFMSQTVSVLYPNCKFSLYAHRRYSIVRVCGRGQLKCDGTRAENRFLLSVKRRSPFNILTLWRGNYFFFKF